MIKIKKETSKLIKKVGITFVIPFLMLICGTMMVLAVGWQVISQGLDMGALLFSKPKITIAEKQYMINDNLMNRPGIGEEFGNIEIPSLGFNEPVYHGDSNLELGKGIGHFAGSTIPGEEGNVIVSGHRHTVFRPLEGINVGDEVIFTTTYGTFKYKVSEIKIVDEKENEELRVLDYERLTMYTCYPFTAIGNTSERMIMICDFIESV